MRDLPHDWTLSEIESIYATPLPDLIFRAQRAHRIHHQPDEVQGCNSIFLGDRLLTTPNPGQMRDELLLDRLAMKLTAAEA